MNKATENLSIVHVGRTTDEYGDSGIEFFTVSSDNDETDLREKPIAEVYKELEENDFTSHGCGCSHDCCGHKFYSSPDLLFDPIRGIYVMLWSWGKNI